MDKHKICFVRAKLKKDYVFDGIANSGYNIIIPYTDRNIILRLCREIWTKLKLPNVSIWYNKATKHIEQDIIIVKDPIITSDFISYLRHNNPNRKIIFDYDNRVERSINPDSIRQFVDEIWSYDEEDCKKYQLKQKNCAYFDIYQIRPNSIKKYDVFYVGRDKGRFEHIREVEKKLKEQGLKTFFYICADREYLTWKRKEYKHILPYDNYLELLKDSRVILNIVPDGQRSITQREMEAVFDGIKCITNNKGILDFELYDESRYFLLDDNYDKIQGFLDIPFKEVSDDELSKYRFVNFINEMVQERV